MCDWVRILIDSWLEWKRQKTRSSAFSRGRSEVYLPHRPAYSSFSSSIIFPETQSLNEHKRTPSERAKSIVTMMRYGVTSRGSDKQCMAMPSPRQMMPRPILFTTGSFFLKPRMSTMMPMNTEIALSPMQIKSISSFFLFKVLKNRLWL